MGCVVLHAATANVATTARNSGRFSISSNSIELLIVIPSTDSTLLELSLGKKSCARGTTRSATYAISAVISVRQRS
jgi:hypothetical protein